MNNLSKVNKIKITSRYILPGKISTPIFYEGRTIHLNEEISGIDIQFDFTDPDGNKKKLCLTDISFTNTDFNFHEKINIYTKEWDNLVKDLYYSHPNKKKNCLIMNIKANIDNSDKLKIELENWIE